MNIYINDDKIDLEPELPLSWRDFFLKLLTEKYIRGSHSIIGLTVDEADCLGVLTAGRSEEMIAGDVDTLKIYTQDSVSVAKEGLEKLTPLIENMKTEINNAAGLYKKNNIKEAAAKIAIVMEAFKPLVQFINSVGISFSLDFDTIMFDKKVSIREKMESFMQTFGDIVTVQRDKEYKKMAGYLQDRLLPDMSAWDKIVGIIIEDLEKKKY
jgi:hypothetical protein